MRIGISALAMESAAGEQKAGVSRYSYSLIEAMLDQPNGHEFVVAVQPDFEVPNAWKGRSAGFFPAGRLALRSKVAWDLFAAPAFIARHRPDVWFSTSHAIPWRRSVPAGLMVHDLYSLTHPQFYSRKHNLVVGRALRHAIPRADLLMVNSHDTAHAIRAMFPGATSNIRVAHLGPGNSVAALPRSQVTDAALAEIGVSRPFLFTLSTMEPRKNLLRLLEAFAAVQAPEVSLVIGGGQPAASEQVRSRIAELGLESRVTLLGYVDDARVPLLYAGCEAYILASEVEGFGMTALEAMMYGARLLCSSGGALPEVVGEAAELFDPLDVTQMAEVTERALRTPELREERVAAGLARAAEFSWAKTAQQTLRALEALGNCR